MDAETFLDNFAAIADAPDGVRRLRTLVLDLAVSGGLVDQDPAEGTGREVIDRGAAAIADAVARGWTRRRSVPEPAGEEIPFPIPGNWAWARLAWVAHGLGQVTPDRDFTYLDVGSVNGEDGSLHGAPAVVAPDQASSRARKTVLPDAVLYSTIRPYLRNVVVIDREFDPPAIASTAFAVLHPVPGLDPRYLKNCVRSTYFSQFVESRQKGVAYPAINEGDLSFGLVPVPPLAEQERIVAKVNGLMGLCDELEARQQRRHSATTRFRGAALHALTEAESPDDLRRAWERVSTKWRAVTDGSASVADLRSTILQLAVRGRLVPQLDHETPHEKPDLPSSSVDRTKLWELPGLSAAPPAWSTLPMASLGRWGSGGTPAKSHAEYYGGDIPWAVIGDLNDGVVTDTKNRITEAGLAKSAAKWIPVGSVFIAMYGASIGKTGVAGIDCTSNQAIAHCVPDSSVITTDYLFVLARTLKTILTEAGKGGAQPNISQQVLKHLLVRVPPIPEQERIVERVEQLARLCDPLEACLVAEEAEKSRVRDGLTRID